MSRARSFTLFEMMLAIALLVALVFVLMPASERIMTRSVEREEQSARLAQLSILTDVIDRSMLTALAVDDRGRIGIAPRATSLRLTSCGVDLLDEGRVSDIQSLEIGHANGEIRIRQATGAWESLVPNVSRMEIRLHDGRSWREPTGDPNELPRAIAVSVWFEAEETPTPEEDIFSSQLDVEDETAPDWRRVFTPFMLHSTEGGAA